jgi:hypothetical protein
MTWRSKAATEEEETTDDLDDTDMEGKGCV